LNAWWWFSYLIFPDNYQILILFNKIHSFPSLFHK
jgi:hypothetical protein